MSVLICACRKFNDSNLDNLLEGQSPEGLEKIIKQPGTTHELLGKLPPKCTVCLAPIFAKAKAYKEGNGLLRILDISEREIVAADRHLAAQYSVEIQTGEAPRYKHVLCWRVANSAQTLG